MYEYSSTNEKYETMIPTVDPDLALPKADKYDPIIGIVCDCTKLNIRTEPSPDADIVCEIKVGSQVMINLDESTGWFYKVYTESGAEGYCMKKYIAVT